MRIKNTVSVSYFFFAGSYVIRLYRTVLLKRSCFPTDYCVFLGSVNRQLLVCPRTTVISTRTLIPEYHVSRPFLCQACNLDFTVSFFLLTSSHPIRFFMHLFSIHRLVFFVISSETCVSNWTGWVGYTPKLNNSHLTHTVLLSCFVEVCGHLVWPICVHSVYHNSLLSLTETDFVMTCMYSFALLARSLCMPCSI